MVIPLSCAAILMTVDAKSATGTNRQLIERQLPDCFARGKRFSMQFITRKTIRSLAYQELWFRR
jgi:hypothetical protein